MIRSMAAIAILAAWSAPVPASGAGAPGSAVVPVENGMHRIMLGKQAVMVLRAHRENYNVHSFDLVSFYVMDGSGSRGRMDLIPLFNDDQAKVRERTDVTITGGADCLLQDFRLLQPDGVQPARLVVAERDFGDSYAADATVRFTYFRLARNDDELEGFPQLYFKFQKRAISRQKYCDVNDAFDRELKMGKSSGSDAP
jgi:hypothetical protein